MTRLAGILGYPLAHSISPIFQQAAFDHLGLDVRYLPWPTEPSKLGAKVEGLRAPNILGANVTIPHKEAVLALLDEVDPTARAIGGVNTIVNRGGRLKGYNTDAPGFTRALKEHGAFGSRGKSVAVLGAGGAARAVVYALAEEGVQSLTLVNRTLERGEGLAAEIRSRFRLVMVAVHQKFPSLTDYDLLVNCTSVGMRHTATEGRSPVDKAKIKPGALIYDLVYNPQETVLLKLAREAGARVLGGLPMLIYQGAMAFELWTGQRAPVEVMFQAARKALG